MTEHFRRNTPAIFGTEPVAWEAHESPMDEPLTPEQMTILERVAAGHGLFRLLDDNLSPLYDFGPSEPVRGDAVDALLAAHAIQFDVVVGFRLPMRARLTSWGKALLEGAI